MNLMKYFNREFMIQNLKKSKSILVFFLGIMPILSIISFLIIASGWSFEAINLESISFINYIGIYVIPIIVSISLFGFIYKKTSVDFINSMPLSRKTIFTTNTITGIMLLILMVILSGFGIYFVSSFTSVIIPFRMIVDYIVVWSISYIFVFILSNIAASLSGNLITQIVLTMIIMFLVPFTVDYFKSVSTIYYGYSDVMICFGGDNTCRFSNIIMNSNYTIPYNNIHNLLFGDFVGSLLNYISIIKMIIISIIGFIVGRILFLKRKMEINETTFASLSVHNFVKALTMYPIIIIISLLVMAGDVSEIGAISLVTFLVLYFFIYDLITKKSINNIKLSLIHFCIILIVLFPSCSLINGIMIKDENNNTTKLYVDYNDIESFKISTEHHFLSDFDYINVTDTKAKKMLVDALSKTRNYNQNTHTTSHEILIKIDGKKYLTYVIFDVEDENKLVDYIKSTDDAKKTKTLVDGNGNYALGFEYEGIRTMTNNKKIIEEAKKVIKNNITCEVDGSVFTYLYNYSNGKINTYEIDACTSSVISKYVDEVVNKENKKLLNEIKNLSFTEAGQKGFGCDINNYSISNINFYMYEKEIYNFVKKDKCNNFTFDDSYISMTLFLNGERYIYNTNNVSGFKEMFEDDK